ncbi:MAG: hypothetical protein FWD67_10265 [Betaproteobacteria bacterium]|nr:hypothetical protein [Betaproteobacteria bacterium]
MLGDRFSVKVSGKAKSIDEIKSIVMWLDLAGLETIQSCQMQCQSLPSVSKPW